MLSIILVNYKTEAFVINCLEGLFKFTGIIDFEVIVADNFSGDGIEVMLHKRFPLVKFIQMGYNAGFARANNAGIKIAQGDCVLLLNPDTLIEDNAIQKCYELFSKSDYVGCGVQLLNADRTPQISGNFFITGGLNHLMALPYVGRVIRWLGYTLKVKKTNVAEAKGTIEVDWVNGACLMVKKTAIEKAGLLDEDFFLYSEEIEWCSRLRKTGPLCIYGNLNVIHLEGMASNETFGSTGKGYYNLYDRKGLQIMLSGLVRIRKQFGAGWFLFHLLAFVFTIPFYFIITFLRTIFFIAAIKIEWKSFLGFTTNVCKLIPYCISIIANRPRFYKVL